MPKIPEEKIESILNATDIVELITEHVPLKKAGANYKGLCPFHGEKTPYRFEDLDKKLVKLVDYVVFGECSVKQASTVIDCSKQPWRIIRQGAIKLKLHHLSSST